MLSLSHGNADPERGFSINKQMRESHGYTIDDDTVVAIRMVKDHLSRIGGVLNFNVSPAVIRYAKGAYNKYKADLIAKKAATEKEKQEKEQSRQAAHSAQQASRSELSEIEEKIVQMKTMIQTSTEIIQEGNAQLQAAIIKKVLDRNEIQSAHAKIDIGL